ncbi:hypothetical protein Goarm_022249 [Gossypium armourianum]|uniref:Zinc knuckle CX2CX4HX4C domain-containing protein n=1 Tax=Gossypium armourianum TaxID=34283 RepID=A0A7J9KIZ8_9ROSI|nr:hypothetical protein [Gossypium armourianum]
MHDIPPRFFSKVLSRQLGHFIGHFVEYDGESIARGLRSSMRIKIFMDIHLPLKMKKGLLFSPENIGYVRFKYERLTLFCFFCGKLGHSDSFCEERMSLGDPSLVSKETSQEHDYEEVLLEGEEGKKCPRQTLGENHTMLAKEGSRGGLCLAWKGNVTISLKVSPSVMLMWRLRKTMKCVGGDFLIFMALHMPAVGRSHGIDFGF